MAETWIDVIVPEPGPGHMIDGEMRFGRVVLRKEGL